jgi:hypothetical protein
VRGGAPTLVSPAGTGAMKMFAPPSFRSIRFWPSCTLRITSAPSISSNQRAVPSGSGLRRCMWSKLTVAGMASSSHGVRRGG